MSVPYPLTAVPVPTKTLPCPHPASCILPARNPVRCGDIVEYPARSPWFHRRGPPTRPNEWPIFPFRLWHFVVKGPPLETLGGFLDRHVTHYPRLAARYLQPAGHLTHSMIVAVAPMLVS